MAEPLEGEIRGEELGKVSPEELLKKFRRIAPRPVPRVVPSVGQMFPTEFNNIMEKLKLGKEDPISKDMLGTAKEQVKLLRDLRMIGSIIQRSIGGAAAVTPSGGKIPGGPGGILGKGLPLGKDIFRGGFPRIGSVTNILALIGKFSVLGGAITAAIVPMISLAKAAKGIGPRFAEVSPSIAVTMAKVELRSFLREMRMGEAVAPEQREFEAAWDKMNDSLESIRNDLNRFYSFFGEGIAKIVGTLGKGYEVLTEINDRLPFLKYLFPILQLMHKEDERRKGRDPTNLRLDLENIMKGDWIKSRHMMDQNRKKLFEQLAD